jgi:maltose alpha-D-glucosyltransferase / alpha-amylase
VTDEERDYMYSVYASDPQARLNLGIRRRLAPLMENSRRRIELMNTLLFSLPGTPIVYYGDEIGMGDNIYLGDRNGVRTPMQWSPDRDAGFSRADPARLYAPPIQDPVYGYQAINVEAQERYPFSLLNWMKRLIATRKQHRVFGRGSLEFVSCPNRKVLALLRRDDRETILTVVNLSRTVQPAELDLRSFSGLIPLEMGGLTEFPRIGDQPYFLSLNAYASYWFTLHHDPLQTSPRATVPSDPNASIRDSLPRLLMGIDWQNVLDSGTRTVLEREALVPFIQRQRWFASKSREVRQARFSDWVPIRRGSQPAFITIASLTYADGWTDSYFVPLALVSDDAGERALQSASSVLARITGARKGVIVDGLHDDDACDRLLAIIGRGEEAASAKGSVRGLAFGTPVATQPPPAGRWTRGSAEQSNSVAFASDGFVLKLFRRIEPTPNPELEIGRVLTELRFPRTPPLVGALEYLHPGVEPGTLAAVQTAVKHQGSGWEFTIDELRRYYERVLARIKRSDSQDARERLENRARLDVRDRQAPPPFFAALQHWYLSSATTLGRRTAELHLTLAHAPGDAFQPEPLDRTALRTLGAGMREHAESSLTMLEDRLQALNDASRPYAEAVLASRDALLKRFDDLRPLEGGGWRIRVHGDYHLGQVLRTEEDFVIIDFEGEPARSIAERRAKQSPLKDVAGMARSYSYAAYAALFAFTVHAPDAHASLEQWADTWRYWTVDAFLQGYRSTIGDSPIAPPEDALAPLLRAFTLDKALYELAYELNNRPDWVRIPLLGIQKLIIERDEKRDELVQNVPFLPENGPTIE